MPSPRSTTPKPTPFVALPDADSLERHLKASTTQPSFALLFHTRGYNQSTLAALTAHNIHVGGKGQAQLMPGRPLAPEDEMAILRLLRPAPATGFQVFPSSLLYADGTATMWWKPSHMAPMAMLDEEGKIVTRKVMWPSLVMLAIGQRFFVAAVAGDERPTPATKLYFAPVGNVWSSTEMCTGNAKLPACSGVDAIPAWDSVLKDTAFSHDNNHGKSIAGAKKGAKPRSTDPMVFWRTAKHARFPVEVLVSAGIALRDWIDFATSAGRR